MQQKLGKSAFPADGNLDSTMTFGILVQRASDRNDAQLTDAHRRLRNTPAHDSPVPPGCRSDHLLMPQAPAELEGETTDG
jgi:hypothetical protein